MKILVEDMPKDINDCPWSEYEHATWAHSGFYFCTYPRSEVVVCNGTDKCPFFISFKGYMSKPVVGIDETIGI